MLEKIKIGNLYINWEAHRKFIHPKFRGIIFENYTTDNNSVNHLLGEHIDQINARILLDQYHNSIDLYSKGYL